MTRDDARLLTWDPNAPAPDDRSDPAAVRTVVCSSRVTEHPTQATYHRPSVATVGHDGIARTADPQTDVGPTTEALDALERATVGARLVRRTGPASYVVVG
jgi:hypothetical protein